MINEKNLIHIKPKIAILDDDEKFSQDLQFILSQKYHCEIYDSKDKIIKSVKNKYMDFLKKIRLLYNNLILKNYSNILNIFSSICDDPPFSISLIDLDLNNHDEYEGYPISEELKKYNVKRIIYTGHSIDNIDLEMINNGIANAFINKKNDVFDDLIPCIEKLNEDFYVKFYNISHYLMQFDIQKNINDLLMLDNKKISDLEYILIYNSDTAKRELMICK